MDDSVVPGTVFTNHEAADLGVNVVSSFVGSAGGGGAAADVVVDVVMIISLDVLKVVMGTKIDENDYRIVINILDE